MPLTWGSLSIVVLAAAIAWFWRDSLSVRDIANAAAMDACSQLGLQFLDGTVAFARIRLTRHDGALNLQRTYVFDYTAQSIDRLQGFVVLHGARVQSVGFARDPAQSQARVTSTVSIPSSPTVSATDETHSTPSADDKVLDLEKWRRARDSRH